MTSLDRSHPKLKSKAFEKKISKVLGSNPAEDSISFSEYYVVTIIPKYFCVHVRSGLSFISNHNIKNENNSLLVKMSTGEVYGHPLNCHAGP